MAVGGFDQITDALKRRYPQKRIEPAVNVATPFRRQMKRDIPKGTTWNKGGLLFFGANLAPPQNVGVIADGDNLPTPKDRTNVQFQMTAKLMPGTFQIGWLTAQAGNTGENAFNGGELDRRTDETIEDTAKQIERYYTATHGTARFATVNAATTSVNTFVCAQPLGSQLLRENMQISARTTDGGDTARNALDDRKITTIAESTDTVTFDGLPATLVAGDHIHVVTKAAQTSLTTIAPQGLAGLIDDGTLVTTIQGLSRTTNPKLNSSIQGNSGTLRDLSEQILVQGVHDVRQKSGKNITDLWWNTGQSAKYLEFTTPDRRYPQTSGGITPLATGYSDDTMVHAIPGGKVKIHEAYDISPRVIYGINWSTMFHYVAQDLDWWDKGGGQLLKPLPVSGGFKAAWFAAVCSMEDIGCDYFRGNVLYKDLKDNLAGD